jgi:hypothetical protein
MSPAPPMDGGHRETKHATSETSVTNATSETR